MIELKEKEVAVIPQDVDIRKKILGVEATMRKLPNVLIGDSPQYLEVCPLKETFADGCYIRELFMPKGMLFVTKIHKIKHPYFLLKGDCAILTEEGAKRIKGPFSGITPAGTKRVIYTYEDTVWATVHVTNKTDPKEIEEDIIAKTYDEVPNMIIDVEAEEVKITGFIETIKKGEIHEKVVDVTKP